MIETICQAVLGHEDPVLSLYLDVNPANPDNGGNASALRAREAMEALGMPKVLVGQVLRKLKLDHTIPEGRTLVVFADEDPEKLFECFSLQAELPLIEHPQGVIARWGEPYVAPLLLTLDEEERYGIVHLDQKRWRYFEIYLGKIEELLGAVRPIDPGAWLTEATVGAPGGPAGGGSGRDRFGRRMEVWTHRFYKEVIQLLEQALKGIDRLILMGPPEQLHEFLLVLPGALQEKVAACLPPPANPDAPASDILPLVQEVIVQVEREGQLALLERIREEGLWGFDEVLEALQEGRLYLLALPWTLERTVYRCAESGRIAPTAARAEALCPGEKHRLVLLKEVLPELAVRFAVRLKFMRGEAEQRLLTEFGGLAGLRRW